MIEIIRDIKKIYSDFSSVTKYIFRYGTTVIATLFFCALYFYIRSHFSVNAIYDTIMCNDILFCIKECMGSVYILPMLVETLSMAVNRNR